jgi:hypothetical protein
VRLAGRIYLILDHAKDFVGLYSSIKVVHVPPFSNQLHIGCGSIALMTVRLHLRIPFYVVPADVLIWSRPNSEISLVP